jgi:hypothetical protein
MFRTGRPCLYSGSTPYLWNASLRSLPKFRHCRRRQIPVRSRITIESFDVRMRNEGYVNDRVRCLLPEFPPVAGYAVTGRIRTATPPIAKICYYRRMDWWEYVAKAPAPRNMVVADLDHGDGTGAFVGPARGTLYSPRDCRAAGGRGNHVRKRKAN